MSTVHAENKNKNLITDLNRLRVSLKNWKEQGIRHGFSTRQNKITAADFYEKNQFSVAEPFLQSLKLSSKAMIIPHQIHSSHIVSVSEKMLLGMQLIPDCDGLVTRSKQVALGILSADCLPLLFYDKVTEAIGVAHAGWRGLKNELPLKMVQHMARFIETNPADLEIAIGPSIRPCCYEIGLEVANEFPQKQIQQKENKFFLNLAGTAIDQLTLAGVSTEQIYDTGLCTSCRNDSFFSYRLEGEKAGRILSVINL